MPYTCLLYTPGTAYIFERDTARGMSLADNCELTAIAGRTLEKAEAFKEKYGFQRAYGSYMELLEDPEIEAVYIACLLYTSRCV